MTKNRISAVILAKNEEGNIGRAIKSVGFCDEIIVVDDESTDKTVEIAKVAGAKVYTRSLNGDFAFLRNWAMEKTENEWVLFVDADEEVSTDLQREIREMGEIGQISAYYIKRRDFWWGRELKYGETQKARNRGIIRLVKKNSGKWICKIHEIWQTSNSVGKLNGFINHYPHQTVAEFLADINWYSSMRARELKYAGESSNIFKIIFFPIFKFKLTYFIFLGFLDGPAGFVYSFMMSFHSFLVWSKLYMMNKEL